MATGISQDGRSSPATAINVLRGGFIPAPAVAVVGSSAIGSRYLGGS